MRYVTFLLFSVWCSASFADDGARRTAAIPALVEQRNSAMDALAFCGGDLQSLQKENALLKAELEKLKQPEPEKTK